MLWENKRNCSYLCRTNISGSREERHKETVSIQKPQPQPHPSWFKQDPARASDETVASISSEEPAGINLAGREPRSNRSPQFQGHNQAREEEESISIHKAAAASSSFSPPLPRPPALGLPTGKARKGRSSGWGVGGGGKDPGGGRGGGCCCCCCCHGRRGSSLAGEEEEEEEGAASAMMLLPPGLLLLLLREGSPVRAGLPPGPEEEEGGPPLEPSRPYAVLKAQNLVLMGSVFSLLLMAMILMAVCVYKPLRRR